jgi:two-component system heavy metal sensor histidine kinase CusS
VALCGGGGFLLARAGLRPLTAITRAARRIRSTTLHERLAAAALPAELRDLALTFNAMLDRLQDAFTRLSQFSADLAHELRTPVNNLRGEVEVALGQERTPEEYRHVLHSCLEECGRLAALIDTLLFLARAESPATVIARRPVDVAAELRAVRDFFEAAAHEAGVALVVPTAGPVPADADPVLLQRAVVNLVANALRHTPAGGTVTLTTAAEDGRVRITVADTGRGIAAEHLPRLFDRFYRVDAARSADAGGVGLGLALVKGIARLHGGEVNVTSTPGQGACFTLMIPTGVRDLGR